MLAGAAPPPLFIIDIKANNPKAPPNPIPEPDPESELPNNLSFAFLSKSVIPGVGFTPGKGKSDPDPTMLGSIPAAVAAAKAAALFPYPGVPANDSS